jgi:hypothetical protein
MIDGRGRASLARPIEGAWPCRRLDATCPRSRNGGRVAGLAAMVAVAVDSDGRRELGSGAPEGRGHRWCSQAGGCWTPNDEAVGRSPARSAPWCSRGRARGRSVSRRRCFGPDSLAGLADTEPCRLPAAAA